MGVLSVLHVRNATERWKHPAETAAGDCVTVVGVLSELSVQATKSRAQTVVLRKEHAFFYSSVVKV